MNRGIQVKMEDDIIKRFGDTGDKLQAWLGGTITMLPNIAAAIVVLLLAGLASKLAQRGVSRVLRRTSGNKPISDLLGVVARVGVVVLGLFVALSMLNLDKTVTSLLAGVGVIGLALGFAFQDIAANFMSGIIMALRRPFDVDDTVEVAGHKARVRNISLRATELETLDGLTVLVPNKDVFQNPIVNYTRTSTRRMDLAVGTAYCDDMEKVRAVTLEALKDLEGRELGREVEVCFDGFGDSSINFTAYVWLAAADERSYRHARSEAMIAIKKAFDRSDITIPFPIRTLDFGSRVVGGERLDQMSLFGARERRSQSSEKAI